MNYVYKGTKMAEKEVLPSEMKGMEKRKKVTI